MKRGFAKAVKRLRLRDGDVLVVDGRVINFENLAKTWMEVLRDTTGKRVAIFVCRPLPGQKLRDAFYVHRKRVSK